MSSSAKILIVDDEPIGRQLLEAILVPEGYKLSFGIDGEEAIKVALEELPDIILLDVMMPKLDGFEVCRKLRGHESTAHIPIYLITALDDRDSRKRGIDAGAYDYISKPFDRVEILAKIKNTTNQINILKKGQIVKNKTREIHQPEQYISAVLPVLLSIQLETEHPSEDFEVFRSKKVIDSANACFRKKTALGQYTIMISNKLNSLNAALSNSIFKIILQNKIDEYDGQLKKILHPSILEFNRIININKLAFLYDPRLSTIIVYQKNENKELLVSGFDQTLFLLEQDSVLNQNRHRAYQSYQLQVNQELQLTNAKYVIAFSPSVNETINQQELIMILNNMTKHTDNLSIEYLAKEKLSAIKDFLIVKLSFHS